MKMVLLRVATNDQIDNGYLLPQKFFLFNEIGQGYDWDLDIYVEGVEDFIKYYDRFRRALKS